MEFVSQMGFMKFPLFLALGMVVFLGVRAFAKSANEGTKQSILFWGAFGALSGIIGTLVGVIVAAQSIEAAGTISPGLVWGGIGVALTTSVFGFLILTLAVSLWYGLTLRNSRGQVPEAA